MCYSCGDYDPNDSPHLAAKKCRGKEKALHDWPNKKERKIARLEARIAGLNATLNQLKDS